MLGGTELGGTTAEALTGNGKQALGLVARALRSRGVRTVLVPRYRCEAMVLPFELEGMRARTVDVGPDLLLEPRALAAALADEPGAAVLHCETYGNRARDDLADLLARARRTGRAVIADATHSLLDRPRLLDGAADVVVASLRKLLPVPDGAVIAWDPAGPLDAPLSAGVREMERREADARVESLGLALLDAERAFARAPRAAPAERAARERMRRRVCEIAARHEAAIERALTPVPASAPTVRRLTRSAGRAVAGAGRAVAEGAGGSPGERARRRRCPNPARAAADALDALAPGAAVERAAHARALHGAVAAMTAGGPAGVRVVNPGSVGCVALQGPRPLVEELAGALARAGLWGPVSWDGPDDPGAPDGPCGPEAPGGPENPGTADGQTALNGLDDPRTAEVPGGSAVPGVPGAAPEDVAGAGEAAGARPWPAVVTLPTDAPERADELLDVVARSLQVRIRPPSPAAAPRRPPAHSPRKR